MQMSDGGTGLGARLRRVTHVALVAVMLGVPSLVLSLASFMLCLPCCLPAALAHDGGPVIFLLTMSEVWVYALCGLILIGLGLPILVVAGVVVAITTPCGQPLRRAVRGALAAMRPPQPAPPLPATPPPGGAGTATATATDAGAGAGALAPAVRVQAAGRPADAGRPRDGIGAPRVIHATVVAAGGATAAQARAVSAAAARSADGAAAPVRPPMAPRPRGAAGAEAGHAVRSAAAARVTTSSSASSGGNTPPGSPPPVPVPVVARRMPADAAGQASAADSDVESAAPTGSSFSVAGGSGGATGAPASGGSSAPAAAPAVFSVVIVDQ